MGAMENNESKQPIALSDELVEMIIFGMENQRDTMVLNLETHLVMPADSETGECLDLPEWTPADGFNLMDGFVESLNNPLYSGRLREILKSGKGVFRRFKDIIKERQEIEKLWYQYKDREMKRRVKMWYEEYRDLLVLESLGEEPEETESLLLTDFIISEADSLPDEIVEWDRKGHMDAYSVLDPDMEEVFYQRRMICVGTPRLDDQNTVFTAAVPDGSVVGFLWVQVYPLQNENIFFVEQLFVKEEFRGLGLGGLLLERLDSLVDDNSHGRICFHIPARASYLDTRIRQMGFEVLKTFYLK